MSKFQKYNGPDKYHFRFYRKRGKHPFIVVAVETVEENNRHFLSGYLITHDIKKMIDYPKKYIRLKENPNPKDVEPAFVCKIRLNHLSQRLFSKPYKNWHLCKEDEDIVNELENKKSSK